MKIQFYFLVLCFLLGEKNISSQNGLLQDFAFKYSVNNGGYSKYKTRSQKYGWSGDYKIENARDTSLKYVIMGLKKINSKEKTPRDILIQQSLTAPKTNWRMQTSFDSIMNTVTFEYNDGYSFSSSTYSFDSIGRVASVAFSSMGEMSGSERHANMFFKYNIPERSFIITFASGREPELFAFNTSVITVQMNSSLSFPVKETRKYLSEKKMVSYVYIYSNGRLKKVIETKSGVKEKTVVNISKYKFLK